MTGHIMNTEYFQNRIDSERARIETFESALISLDSSNTDGIRIGKIHLSNLYLNCVKLVYSLKKSFDDMLPYYIKCLTYYKDVCAPEDSMYDMLDLLSIGVLLKKSKREFVAHLDEIVTRYNSQDGMILFLMDYLRDETPHMRVSSIEYFNLLMNSEDKLAVLNNALESWYSNHKGAYWYNSHESKNNTYCGYWCFEIAALAQICRVDDSILRKSQYYPYNIKH